MYFSSSAEVFSWLGKFINLERGQKPKSFRLDRMKFLSELAGNPERCAPSIHIAGSKGKGSVTGMTASILKAAGYRVARYMSPHVIDIRERICLGDSYFDEEVYCAAGNELREITEERLPAVIAQQAVSLQAAAALFDPANIDGCEPTFWELLTLYFFLCAKHGKCDVMAVETGMGGRLDSTNILEPLVSVITFIELEHTNFLGNTIEEIAGEKAGIIKRGKPLILARQNKTALEIFKQKAEENNSPLFYLPEIIEISDIKVYSDGTEFKLEKISGTNKVSDTLFFIPIPGKVQAENAALAIAAVKTAFPQITEEAIHSGLKNLYLPARFEKIEKEPPFIIDGAHTPESFELCVETFCSLYGEGGVLVFGCAADKDAAAMAKIANPRFTSIIITTPGTFKISNPALVYETFKMQQTVSLQEVSQQAVSLQEVSQQTAAQSLAVVQLITDTQEAVKQVVEYARDKNLPILGTGSFYLVSEISKAKKAFSTP
jgi:dihydrofolate synthase/folylpolyglutamate synthase